MTDWDERLIDENRALRSEVERLKKRDDARTGAISVALTAEVERLNRMIEQMRGHNANVGLTSNCGEVEPMTDWDGESPILKPGPDKRLKDEDHDRIAEIMVEIDRIAEQLPFRDAMQVRDRTELVLNILHESSDIPPANKR